MIYLARLLPIVLFSLLILILSTLSATDLIAADLSEGGEGPPVRTENMTASLVSDHLTVTPGQSFYVAMRQQIRPGWHTYWRNPGDSGEPTELDWTVPEGWQAGDILWPAPHRIAVGPLVNFGYSDELLLLTRIDVPSNAPSGQTVSLQAGAYWLVCEEECIPEEGRLSVSVQVGESARESQWKPVLETVFAELPRPLPWSSTAELNNGNLQIRVPLASGTKILGATYYPDQPGVIEHAAEQQFSPDEAGFTLSVPASNQAAKLGFSGVIVLEEQSGSHLTEAVSRAYSIDPESPILSSPDAEPETASNVTWLVALLMAFSGGLILNLMPCVFPVLSIKVLSLLRMAEGKHAKVRHAASHGWFYTMGVLLGFSVLGVVLVSVRAAGIASGWGFHLQNPLLVLLLIWLFLLIGLNLSGMFEFGTRLMGLGQNLTQGQGTGQSSGQVSRQEPGKSQSFLTGLLATVVASPCTAPFMGVALGYALVQPPIVTLSVFLMLGLGMATPFLLLCLFPDWLRRLPPPGMWMQRFREFLAFPMYASALWLLWVLTQQVGPQVIPLAGGGALLISLIIWLGRLQIKSLQIAGRLIGITLLVALFSLGYNRLLVPQDTGWQPFTQARLQSAREQGPVFVNFTADWCITCKANELVALNTDKVRTLFVQKGVTRLKADWTRRDEKIARTIESFNRSGVPLYLWYPDPDNASPEILPQLLTEQMLVDRLTALAD